MNIDKETYVKRLNALMESNGYNANSLALALGTSPSTIYDILSSRAKWPKLDTAMKIALKLGVNIEEMLGLPLLTQKELIVPHRDLLEDCVALVKKHASAKPIDVQTFHTTELYEWSLMQTALNAKPDKAAIERELIIKLNKSAKIA